MKNQKGIVYVHEENLPSAWEQSICQLKQNGIEIPTQYDKDGDPPSLDATALIVIENPFSEPRIHRCFPDSIAGLESYRQEVVDGIHDHWICPEEGKWEYTYSERLKKYKVPGINKDINQIDYIINTLEKCPYSRRAIAITWKPWEDEGINDPACLQSIQCRIINGKLQMNAHMRSNDAYKAAFMNMFAFTDLQKNIAEKLNVEVGKYCHYVTSYHIYGSYNKEIDGFLKYINSRPFEKRTWRTDDPDIIEQFDEAKIRILESLKQEQESGRKGL